ncbi:MAG: M3 family metallopeptidase [Candidatus Aminicenantes bacterium]|nr:MAG: M3 family metallopeptidase [Candidatus Aminicenantes bacterium]
MKKTAILFVCLCLFFISCSKPAEEKIAQESTQNPFFEDWDTQTPFGVPPFDRIKEAHYMPAFLKAMEEHKAEIEEIVQNSDPPSFANTIEAMDRSGVLLKKVNYVFQNMAGAHTNEKIQQIEREVAPLLAKHDDDINLNQGLFKKTKSIYEQKESLDLTPEQSMLLEQTYKGFVRGGANLSIDKKARFREINEELSVLSVNFAKNVLDETNAFEMVLEEEDLAGLPPSVITAASEAAKEKGHEEKWVITLHKPSFIPFLQYSEKRELREKVSKAFANIGNNDNEYDNKAHVSRMAALRVERAQLLGYNTHADFVLEEYMAKKPENVINLLQQVWEPALTKAKNEAHEFQAKIEEEGKDFTLQPWDWWYYAEKVKMAKYDLDDSALRPYFKLENVRQGAFDVATKLWGITFHYLENMPIYHEDVRVMEVKDADGSHIGILYMDYFPRASKHGGAWMSPYRKQSRKDGENIRPVIVNVGNFTKPTADKPALISFDNALTLFHEFGHALHGLLTDCTYESLSGTDVATDFVELPSQIMENWASDPEVIKAYARHYQTEESIPDQLIAKIKKAGTFNQGFANVEYLASCFLDMDWHTLKEAKQMDCTAFENASMNKIGLVTQIIPRWKSTYFTHIFADGYSSGYYSYLWSEVLDADAFQAFKETSLFDQETAAAFRKNILEKGGTEDPMTLYLRFRGAEPKIDPFLKREGLK